MARLEVEIGADIKDFQSKLAKSLKSFDTLKREQKSLSEAFKDGTISSDRYYSAMAANSTTLKKTTADVSKYKSAVNGVGTSTAKMSKGVANGSSAMTAFSRTVQDAPFGIMGVSNNITNLTEQFGYLKARTGSSGGALKAMLKDLRGFGGITLGISLVTSALLVFGDKIFVSKNKVKALKKEQDKLTKSLEDYIYTLGIVKKANLKGEKSAARELTNLKLLSSQLNNTNLSLNERMGAVEALRKKYPSYLKNMSDEKLLNGDLATVYDTLTTSILNRARATASADMIVQNTKKSLTIESQLAAENNKLKNGQLAFEKRYGVKYEDVLKKASQGRGKYSAAGLFTKPIKEANKQIKALTGQLQSIELSNIDLEQNVTGLGGIASAIVPDDTADRVKAKLASAFGDLQGVVKDLSQTILPSTDDVPSLLAPMLTKFELEALEMKARLAEFSIQANEMLDASRFDALSDLGSAIGDAMGSGQNILQAAGASLLGTLGSIMVKYGKLILAYGLASEALKEAMKNPFGGGIAAVVAGVALIAIGSAIKSSSSNIASGGSGGSNAQSGDGSGGASSRGSDFGGSSGGFSSSSGGGDVIFRLAGTDLVGSISRTLQQNRDLGGNLRLI